MPLNIGEQDA